MVMVRFATISFTRSCAALQAADLDWIVGPEDSLGGKEEGLQGRNKQKSYQRGVTNDLGGGQGRNKQKCDWRGVTTDLLDVYIQTSIYICAISLKSIKAQI